MTFEPGSPGAVEYDSDGHRWTPVFMRTLGHRRSACVTR
jgi:hypothetical protein